MRLQKKLKEIEDAGGRVAAISVDPPEASRDLISELAEDEGVRIAFPLLSDPGARTAQAFGVYDDEHELALPATIVVARDGTIAWKHVGDTSADRPPEDEIVRALRALR